MKRYTIIEFSVDTVTSIPISLIEGREYRQSGLGRNAIVICGVVLSRCWVYCQNSWVSPNNLLEVESDYLHVIPTQTQHKMV